MSKCHTDTSHPSSQHYTAGCNLGWVDNTNKSRWQTGPLQLSDPHEDTVIGGQAQKESAMGGIIILLTPAPIIDPFPAWKPPILMLKEPVKDKKYSFGCLELCLYDIRELT